MKIKKLDVVVALMSGIACFALVLDIPVWALFFGWAWYFALGSTPKAFRKAIPPMLLGYAAGFITILLNNIVNNIFILAAAVAAMVFVIMLSTKTKMFENSLVSFNAFSILFAGYYTGSFPAVEPSRWDVNNLLISIGWLAMVNVVGLLFGFISIRLGVGAVKEEQAK